MGTKKLDAIPDHLKPLMLPTPSGVAMLIAAWDGLSVETQILLLHELNRSEHIYHLPARVRAKAFESRNPYVRYAAVRGHYFSDRSDSEEEGELKARMEQDPEPLVRYSLLESRLGSKTLSNPEAFFSLPQEARLASVRRLEGGAKEFSQLMEHCIDHGLRDGAVSEVDLIDLISDFANREDFRATYDFSRDPWPTDGYHRYQENKSLETLWSLVPRLPERAGILLLVYLPPAESPTAEDILGRLSDAQLDYLLSRPDIGLEKFRKKLFVERVPGDYLRCTAARFNFDLSDQEFADVVASPAEERVKILQDLSGAAHLRLCVLRAVHDVLAASDDNYFGAENAKRTFSWRLEDPGLRDGKREQQIRELRLYCLAQRAVPWKPSQDGYFIVHEKLDFLEEALVPGDTWATFVRMRKLWPPRFNETLESYLPRASEDGWWDPDFDWPDAEETPSIADLGGVERSLESLNGQMRALHAELVRWRFLGLFAIAMLTFVVLRSL